MVMKPSDGYWREAQIPETKAMPSDAPCYFRPVEGSASEPIFYPARIVRAEAAEIFMDWCWDRPRLIERHLAEASAAGMTAAFLPDYLADFVRYYRDVRGLPAINPEISPHLMQWLMCYCQKRYHYRGYGTHNLKFTYTAEDISRRAANLVLEFIRRYTDPDYWGAPANVADLRAYVVNSLM